MTEDKPSICLIDFKTEDNIFNKDANFNWYEGSAGTKVEITYSQFSKSEYCLLNYDFPTNLHEFDVIVLNMVNENVIPYSFEDHQRTSISSQGESKLVVKYPTNIFDPRPLSLNILNSRLEEFSAKRGVLIVFADELYQVIYQPVRIISGGYPKDLKKISHSNYDFWNNLPLGSKKHGLKTKIAVKVGELNKLLSDFSQLEYYQTFFHPQIFNEEGSKRINDPSFVPLITNHSNEIVSFAHFLENTALFVFPNLENKGEFTNRFLTEVAPHFLPELFGNNSEFKWLNDQKYWLPRHKELLDKRNLEKERHLKETEKINNEIKKNKEDFSFLNKLITETDDELVDAVFLILKWLGFNSAKKIDETKDDGLLEEDIQIEIDEKLLVIEVKGIGGTSKDSECSQISKIRLRRMKERKSTDVFGLYIVNHERFKPPHIRSNPPFNDVQIQDAINDDRGLLTTWELYRLYHDIQKGIYTREEVLFTFFQYGLVDFRSSLFLATKIDKTYKENQIASCELNGIELLTIQEVIIEKNGDLEINKIISIQKEKQTIQKASNGRVGLLMEKPIQNNSKILIKSS